tara:strand:+ start:218 stop:1090 length:873 start_codon:yes stop_codon:yes gene_type:complete
LGLIALDIGVLGLRALSFIAIFQAAGIFIFLKIFESQLTLSVDVIRKLGFISSVVAILLTVTYHFSVPARFTGSFGGILDSSMQLLLMKSNAGIARTVRVAGLCLLVMACLKRGHIQKTVGLLGVMMILLSFACMGHTTTHGQRWLMGPLLVFHLGVVMFWFGAFLPLYIVARDEMISRAGSLILKFSSIALWLVPMILVAGVLISVALLPTFWSLFTPYGRLILVKVCGFGVLMGLATLNKWRFGPKILAGHTSSLTALQRIVAVEWLLVATLLAFTGIMTALFSPPEH